MPIIIYYQQKGYKVVLAGYGESAELLKKEFPDLEFVHLPGFNVRYSRSGSHLIKILLQLPSFLFWMRKEHQLLNRIIRHLNPSMIISDNRYGLWNKSIKTVIVTHQLKLFLPAGFKWAEFILQKCIKKWVERFDYCWIPDNRGKKSITESMTNVKPMINNAQYIGLLSRFKSLPSSTTILGGKIDILAIISGPEPHRFFFYEALLTQLKGVGKTCVIVTGDSCVQHYDDVNLTIYGRVGAKQLLELIMQSNLIICRSGYSSVMDLICLKKQALLIPTPGQPEQYLLAKHLNEKGWFSISNTHNIHSYIVGDLPVLNADFKSLEYFPCNFSDPFKQ